MDEAVARGGGQALMEGRVHLEEGDAGGFVPGALKGFVVEPAHVLDPARLQMKSRLQDAHWLDHHAEAIGGGPVLGRGVAGGEAPAMTAVAPNGADLGQHHVRKLDLGASARAHGL